MVDVASAAEDAACTTEPERRPRYHANNTCMLDLAQLDPRAEYSFHTYELMAESNVADDMVHPTRARKHAQADASLGKSSDPPEEHGAS